MKLSKRFFILAALAVALAGSLQAHGNDHDQNNCFYLPYPHAFIGLQGGGQTTFTNFDNTKLITPTASVSMGYWFTKIVGSRLHVNGMWNEGGIKATNQKYKFNYVTTDLDLMLNLVGMFGRQDAYPVNLYLIGGVGLNTAWGNADARALGTLLNNSWNGTKLSHNARVGMQLDYNLHRNVSLNLEVAANSLRDRFNSKRGHGDDWQLTAQLGLAFKFGHKKIELRRPKIACISSEYPERWETRIDTTWYDDVTYEDVTREREINKAIFFALASDSIGNENEQITAVAEFLKTVKDAKISIVAYADKGTGNPKLNMNYSKKRAMSTWRKLVAKGVDSGIIKSIEWKGDTVQPYEQNDKNRVCIITGKGVYTDKERVVTKKFRTEEVRYRVE